jgi:hypothetical protein
MKSVRRGAHLFIHAAVMNRTAWEGDATMSCALSGTGFVKPSSLAGRWRRKDRSGKYSRTDAPPTAPCRTFVIPGRCPSVCGRQL